MAKEKEIDDLFDAKNVPASNWFKFEKVGDRVSGTVTQEPYVKKGEGEYPDQKVFILKQKDGELINVGIKVDNTYVIQRTNRVMPGDILGFEFTKEIPPSKKGYNPAKSITPFVKYTPEGDVQRDLKNF